MSAQPTYLIDPEYRAILALENLLKLPGCAIGQYNAEREPICIEAQVVISSYRKRVSA